MVSGGVGDRWYKDLHPDRAADLLQNHPGEGGNTGVSALPQWWGGPGGKMFRAYDKATGEVVWDMELAGGTSGAPTTYMVDGRQYIVATVGWDDMASELVALALP